MTLDLKNATDRELEYSVNDFPDIRDKEQQDRFVKILNEIWSRDLQIRREARLYKDDDPI